MGFLRPTVTLATCAGSCRELVKFSLIVCCSAFLIAPVPYANADVIGEGDVSPKSDPDLPEAGGPISGTDLIVGDTGFGILTVDIPQITAPLESTNGLIGNSSTGTGIATVTGFVSDQSEWKVETLLTVGVAGQGFLEVEDGGRIGVGDNTSTPGVFTTGEIVVGDNLLSQGVVTVNGLASLLETFTMTIGDEGTGVVEVSNRGTLRSQIATIGNQAGSYGRVTLSGLGTRWVSTEMSNKEFIVAEDGRGILEILDQAMVLNADEVCIGHAAGSHGTVRVDGQGSIWQIDDDNGTDDLKVGVVGSLGELFITNGGLVRVNGTTSVAETSFVDLASGGILNSSSLEIDGVVRGDGYIESDILLNLGGELRNAAGVANQREKLVVTGAVTNNGIIESHGGEMEFQSLVTNTTTGDIISRDAITRYQGGLINDGEIALGGDSTIYANISGSGNFAVLDDSQALIVGSITLASSSVMSLTVGANAGTLDVLGSASLGNSLLDLRYTDGVGAQVDDSYQILYASEGVTGTFSNTTAVAGGLIWDIDYSNPNAVFVTATGLTGPPSGADFNGDGLVDELDLLVWEMNSGISSGADPEDGDADGDMDVDYFDFLIWQSQFGAPPPLVAAVAAVAATAIPEPSTAVLLVLGAMLMGSGSRGRRRAVAK